MWEWSNRTVKKKPPKKTDRNAASLLAAYNDLIGSGYSAYQSRIRDIQIAETPVDERITAPEPEALYETVKQKIAEFGLPASTRIIEKEYAPQSWQELNRSFDRYHNLRSRFFKLVGYADAEDCRCAGLNDDDIACLREGFAPENYNIHLKVPADFGGSLDFDNFSLIQTRPHHAGIHRIIDMQIENNFLRLHKKIFLPWFEGKFYYD